MESHSKANLLSKKMAVLCAISVLMAESSSAVTLEQRMIAAAATVQSNPYCTALTSFYWEVGDQNGKLTGGAGGNNWNPDQKTDSYAIEIASASKWVFGAYALEKLNVSTSNPLTTAQTRLLNYTSGYDNMGSGGGCGSVHTIDACLNTGNNHTRRWGHVDKFSYDNGHLQKLASELGLGGYFDDVVSGQPKLSTEVMSYVGQGTALDYVGPIPAKSLKLSPMQYRHFLQDVLSGNLRMKLHLNPSSKVCAWSGTSPEGTACDAVYSPVSSIPSEFPKEYWHYAIAHWIEGSQGDNAYSSGGQFGFYPWIDKNAEYYGILSRQAIVNSSVNGVSLEPFIASALCGRKIRTAWITGQPTQN